VLLLCDVFENFRKVCKKIYNFDPCQYYTTPGLSWDAMLKITKIELELLTDIDMYNFIMKGIRGGLVQCCKRHSIANNKYRNNDYDCENWSVLECCGTLWGPRSLPPPTSPPYLSSRVNVQHCYIYFYHLPHVFILLKYA